MKHIFRTALLILVILSFSGCSRYISWGKEVFNQGEQIETYAQVVQPYIRSERVYDQFTTLGSFDAMWLSDPVRRAFSRSHARKHGFTRDQYKQFLENQLTENDTRISFYLLSIVGGPGAVDLTDKNAAWTVQLKVGNDYFNPAKIQSIDELPPEYQYFFGKKWTIFKSMYLISFNAVDEDDVHILESSLTSISLVFRRVGHRLELVWPLDGNTHIIPRGGLNQDVLAYDLYDNI